MIRIGDCRAILPTLDAGSFQTCVTSPPYWGLRDYGHPNQIGLEPTIEAYVETMVAVFREVRRVLADDGTLWLNLGDSYANDDKWGGSTGGKHVAALHGTNVGRGKRDTGLGPKNLIGIPWRVALALQADGWTLRSDIIWHKPNPMPESVTDRPTKAHEYVFLLSKSATYFYDADAIKEPVTGGAHARGHGVNPKAAAAAAGKNETTGDRTKSGFNARWKNKQNPSFAAAVSGLVDTRNKRDVWTIPSKPYAGAHFATMPEALVTPCILAGSHPGDAVLDPFFGSGTVGQVAERLGRRWLGCELNAEYGGLAETRTAQRGFVLPEVA